MIDSIKLKTSRRFKSTGQTDADPEPASLVSRTNVLGRNLSANLKSLLDEFGFKGNWLPSAKFSDTYEGGRRLRMNFKHRSLGIALFGTATHLDRVHLTLPKLWSGSNDNSYVFKNDAELDQIRRAVYSLLDHITHPPASPEDEYVNEVHLCYQIDRKFRDVEEQYEYAQMRLVNRPKSVTPGREVLFRGKLVELAIYNKNRKKQNSDGPVPIRVEARFKDKDKISEYFGLGDGERLSFNQLTIDRMLPAFLKFASKLEYPSPPEIDSKSGKKKSDWSVYHTLEAVDSTGWRHPESSGDEETWMSGLDIVDIHTARQTRDTKRATRDAVVGIKEHRKMNRNPQLYKSLQLGDLLPQNASEWEQQLNDNQSDWSKISFCGLDRLQELWFEPGGIADVRPADSLPAEAAAPDMSVDEILEQRVVTTTPIVDALLGFRYQSSPETTPFLWLPAILGEGSMPLCATRRVILEYFSRGYCLVDLASEGNFPGLASQNGWVMTLAPDPCPPVSTRGVAPVTPEGNFWASCKPEEEPQGIVLIHQEDFKDFRIHSADNKFQGEWRFKPLGNCSSVPPEAKDKWHTLEEMTTLISRVCPGAFNG